MSDGTRYDKVLLVRHPKTASLKEVAEADLVLLSYGWGQTWVIVKDAHGGTGGRPNLTVEEVRKLV